LRKRLNRSSRGLDKISTNDEGGKSAVFRFIDKVTDAVEYGTVEKQAKLEGRNMLMFLAPKSSK